SHVEKFKSRTLTRLAARTLAGAGVDTARRFPAGNRGCLRFRGPGAGKGLPKAVDGLVQRRDLFGQALGVGLLRRHQALHGLELVLHDLELVDRYLLRRLQTLGLLDEL